MNFNDVSSKIRSIAEKTLTQNDLAKSVIIKKGSEYQAFGEYHIQELPTTWQVTTDLIADHISFNSPKSALAWCIAHKAHRYGLARDLIKIDHLLAAKQTDIDIATFHLRSGELNFETKVVLESRLAEDINTRQAYKKQWLKYLQTAKYIKIKGSSDELNRLNKPSKR